MSHRAALIEALEANLNRTLSYFDAPADALARAYAPGKWTLQELLVHLSDTEAVFLDRLRRIVSDEKPLLLGMDPDRWAAGLDYKRRDVKLAKLQYEAARRGIIELAVKGSPALDARSAPHSEGGARTFAQILKTAVDHDEHHLEQAQAILDGKTWVATKSGY